MNPGLRSFLLLGSAGVLAACGLEEDLEVECRCAEDTDLTAFPRCRDAVVEAASDPSSPLSTRLPECPSGDLLFLREPTTSEAVVFNLRDAVEGFSPVQYVEQLSEDFLFAPELAGLELYREVYDLTPGYDPDPPDADTLWTREEERRFAFNLLDRRNFQRINISRWFNANEDEQRLDPDDPGQETYIFPYIIDFTTQPGEQLEARVFEVRGRMQIDLATKSDETPVWTIRRWQDFREPASELTFTELRGEFAQ